MTGGLVSCVVGDTEFALRASEIVAVMRADRMRPPSAADTGLGVVTVAGANAPVYSLGATVGLYAAAEEALERDRHIVVLQGASGPVGWLVDRVGRARLSLRTRVLPLPQAVGARARRCFGGVLSTEDRTLLLLSLSHGDRWAVTEQFGAADPTASDVPSWTPPSDHGPLVVTFGSEALPRCGATRFAVSARRVAGLESTLHVATVPWSEPPVIGISVWRGEAIPVVDFRQQGPPAGADAERSFERQRLMIVRCGGSLNGTSFAMPVDAETSLHQPTTDNRPATRVDDSGDEHATFVKGLFDVRGRTVALIDPDALMTAALHAGSAG
jgi:chemotaxis signal transduction protein